MPRPVEPEVIAGMKIEKLLGQGVHTRVYRAKRDATQFAVKMFRSLEGASPSTNEHFCRRALWFSTVAHTSLPIIEDVGSTGDGEAYAAFLFVQGRSLRQLNQNGPQSEQRLLPVARAIAGALAALHARGLIHGDVKPENVIIGEDGVPHLVDPDIMGIEPDEQTSRSGNLMYGAPERLGIVEHPIDARSDLYSLGAVLYHAVTGRPPYRAAHPAELLRQRRNEKILPARTAEPSISEALFAIIDKLLSFDPKDRYASSEGLLFDLFEINALNSRALRSHPLALDSSTTVPTTLEPVPLIDRIPELKELLGLLHQASRSRGSAAIIEGAPGSGKSRLAHEVVRSAAQKGSLVLRAQCIEGESIPFAELRRAMGDWFEAGDRWLDGELVSPKEALIEASEGLASYLARFWPPLADILPEQKQPPLVAGSSQIESSVAELIARLAKQLGPLVLLVEDFHWITASTARVIAGLRKDIPRTRMLLMLTGRTHSIQSGSAIALQKGLRNTRPSRVRLKPLHEAASYSFVRDMLGTPNISEGILSKVISYARGNPLKLRESVGSLLDNLIISRKSGGFVATSDARLRSVLRGSLRSIVINRLGRLPSTTRKVATAAALARSCCSPQVLGAALGRSREEINIALYQAMQAGLLVSRPAFGYVSSHDEVGAALRAVLDDKEARLIHLRLAEAIESEKELPLSTCIAASHYVAAGPEAPPKKALAANFSAGCAALKARAYNEALPYLESALELCAGLYAPSRRLEVVLREALGEAYYQTGRVGDAKEQLESVLERPSTPMQKARSHARLSDIHVMNLQAGAAWAELEKALALLGHPAPSSISCPLLALGSALVGTLRKATGIGLEKHSRASERRDRLLLDIYLRAGQVGYLTLRPDRISRMKTAARGPAARLGLSGEQRAVFAHQALLLSSLGGKRSLSRLRKAEKMAHASTDTAAEAQMQALKARSASQLGDVLEAERIARFTIEELGSWLDTREYVLTVADLLWSLIARGRVSEAWELIQRFFNDTTFTASGRSVALQTLPEVAAMACLSTLGRTRAARYYFAQASEIVHPKTETFWRALFLAGKLLMHREQRELGGPAEETMAAFDELELSPRSLPMYLRLFLVTRAYVRIDQYDAHTEDGSRRRKGQLHRAVTELEAAARTPLLRGHAEVARASYLRALGQINKARMLLESAEAIGDRIDAPWIVYEAYCEKARLLFQEGSATGGRRAAASALAIAQRHGWRPRARRIRIEFRITEPVRQRTRREHGPGNHLAQALEMSLWASHSPSPAGQIRLMLDWLLRLFGAERVLLLHHDEQAGLLTLVAGRDIRGNNIQHADPDCIQTCMRAVKARRTLSASSLTNGPRQRRPRHQKLQASRPTRAMAAPLVRDSRVVGALYLDHHLEDVSFTNEELDVLAAISKHMPLVLEISAEARLEVYERIAANVPGLLFQLVKSPSGHKSFWFLSSNVRLLGITPEQARRDAEALFMRVHPDDRPRLERSLDRSETSRKPWRWEGRFVLPDGTEKWLLAAARCEKQPAGEMLWDGLMMDITRQKAAEARIRSLNAELEARVASRTEELTLANRELEAFTYSVSHDLRAPLLSIQGFAEELAAMSLDGPSETRDFLNRIIESSRKMEVLIEAMLSLSRIAHQPLVRKNLDLSAIATEVLESLNRQHPNRAVVTIIEPNLKANADETLVRVLLSNLLSNAWKFTKNRDVAHINFKRTKRGGAELFTVEDDGTGFDMTDAHKLFLPFERLHPAEEFEGTGVGLATVRRIAQRHGGIVLAESHPGGGARFYFSLEPEKLERTEPPHARA